MLEFIAAGERVTITASNLTVTSSGGQTLTPTIVAETRQGTTIPMLLLYYDQNGNRQFAILSEELGFTTMDEAQKTLTPTPGLNLSLPKGTVGITGAYLLDAKASYSQKGEPEVQIKFNDQGTTIFAQLTQQNVGKMLYTVLDNQIVFAGNVKEAIPSGEAVLTGSFSIDEATTIAQLLRGGALPVKLVIVEERTVAPTLGEAAVRASIIAGIVAMILVVLFMILNYRFLGFLADISLILYVVLVVALLKLFGATLTLPGIAGVVISLGMAVDANILIFERIRDEIRAGKTMRGAIASGFAKAVRTVIDSNATTLIATLALYWFGTGPVRGFAITLTLGILVSLFTAIFVTRTFVDIVGNSSLGKNLPLLNLHEKAFVLFRVGKFDFMGKAKLWLTISLVLIVIGLAVVGINWAVRPQHLPLNMGVDFTGGSRLEYSTEASDPLNTAQLRPALENQGLKEVQIQPVNETDVVLRTQELTADQTTQLTNSLKQTFPTIRLVAADYVGPIIGQDLQLNALYAVLISLVGIVIYLSIRFQLRFGVATIVALVHDLLIVIGFFAITFIEVNSPLVAVLLTVVGYSVMDTVVVLDRIRENTRFRKRETLKELINRSIQQTFNRSMNTTLTTLLAVIALVIFTSSAIADFSWGLLIGVFTGAYSSVFIATPIIYLWLNRSEARERAGKKRK
jgi:SecD/SecF fusion protein